MDCTGGTGGTPRGHETLRGSSPTEPTKGAGTFRRAVRGQAFAKIPGGRHMECVYYFKWTAHGMCLQL